MRHIARRAWPRCARSDETLHFAIFEQVRFQLKSTMTAIAHTFSRVTGLEVDTESLMQVVLFCAAGRSVFRATYGLDLSPGFF
jgi:hypothetical protein